MRREKEEGKLLGPVSGWHLTRKLSSLGGPGRMEQGQLREMSEGCGIKAGAARPCSFTQSGKRKPSGGHDRTTDQSLSPPLYFIDLDGKGRMINSRS